ncbi:MAG TPA: GvpL/GvpF family gas vesicle protein [Solirubrobacterales bacterium]|nr:GvpL/GvpF family gas vesicle protein [Solirubrobacterales bacterium]
MPTAKPDMAKYVYGVVPAAASPPKGPGIDDAPLGVIPHGGVAALASDVAEEFLEAGREELLRHSRVLEETMERAVVLPMRFGVVMPDEETVHRRLLGPYGEDLEAQLKEMEGKVEITIKGIYDEATILRETIAENRDIAKLREAVHGKPEEATYYQRIELGEMISAALEEKRAAAAPQIIERLAPFAVDVRVGEPAHERMAVNASFLVQRDRLEEFDRAVEKIGAEEAGRIQLKYTGPLPPHSFVELGIGG